MAIKITGTSGNDEIIKGSVLSDDPENYDIYGYAGNDVIELHVGGTQYVEGGEGHDHINIYGSGAATVRGGIGNDAIWHNDGFLDYSTASKFYGEAGDDYLVGFASGDLLDGGADNDALTGVNGNTLLGGKGNDTYYLAAVDAEDDVTLLENSGGGYDRIEAAWSAFHWKANFEEYTGTASNAVQVWGNDSANKLTLLGGADWARMNGGNDTVASGDGADSIYGDAGNDVIEGQGGGDYILGGIGNDKLFGGSADPFSTLVDGADTIYGEDGDDQISGGAGNDYLSGGNGKDVLYGASGSDTMVGGAGNDFYITDGTDTIVEVAGGGTDTLMFSGSSITLGADIENLTFYASNPFVQSYNPGHQFIKGNALANKIDGFGYGGVFLGEAGADTITVRGDNNTVYGGIGNDVLSSVSGKAALYGEDGNDRIYGGASDDTLDGGAGNDEIGGNGGNDFIKGDAGNDTVYGGTGADIISGGQGYDTLYGEDDGDALYGGELNDTLYGNAGSDTLYGEQGSDILWGGAGSDRFTVTDAAHSRVGAGFGIDQIKDFEGGIDLIDLSTIDANSTLIGNQAFTWQGMSGRFANAPGNLWGVSVATTETTASYIKVFGDTNGDGVAEFQIDVYGAGTLTSADFIL